VLPTPDGLPEELGGCHSRLGAAEALINDTRPMAKGWGHRSYAMWSSARRWRTRRSGSTRSVRTYDFAQTQEPVDHGFDQIRAGQEDVSIKSERTLAVCVRLRL